MRFEPRLFHDDDEPRDVPANDAARIEPSDCSPPIDEEKFELPAELAALGEQLGDDAEHLVGCYPPGRAAETAKPIANIPTHRRRLMRWGGAAAAVLIGIVSWQLIARQWGEVDLPNRDLAAVEPASIEPASIKTVPLVNDRPVITAVESKLKPSASGLPAAVFRDLTGAEQEAALDLMQNDPQGQGELSI